MQKILCFGELLLRMSPVLQRAWIKQASIPAYVGGAEHNVARALAAWNIPVAYCTALPPNILSDEISIDMEAAGIDTTPILFTGERIGIYFLPQGADLKNLGVIYDRAHSSFSSLRVGMIDWDRILQDVSWFHFSAISPALSQELADVCLEALKAASKKNIPISIDLNHRPKLWQYGRSPADVMPGLVAYCDVVMGNIWSAEIMLNVSLAGDINEKWQHKDYTKQAELTAMAIRKQFPKCKTIANTFRFQNADGSITYYSSMLHEQRFVHSKIWRGDSIVDGVGSGDCFMAGLLYGQQQNMDVQDTCEFATSAAFGKLMEVGDSTLQDVNTIKLRIQQHGHP